MASATMSPDRTSDATPPAVPLRMAARLWSQRAVMWGFGTIGRDPASQLFLPWGRRNPYQIYERIRRQGPLVRSRLGITVTASHAISRDLLRSRAVSVANEEQPDLGINLSLLELDPPDHTRLRRMVAPAFSPRRVKALDSMISSTVHQLLDRAEAAGEFDLVEALALPLPIAVITELLGIPTEDEDTFRRHGGAIAGALDGIQSVRHAHELKLAEQQLGEIFERLFELRRREPRDDLVSDLVAVPEDRITPDELFSLCLLLLVAGFETTVNLIGNTVLALHHSGQWSLLTEDPMLAEAATEETLRYDPPVQLTGRTTTEDLELAGHAVAKGTTVVPLIGATGRDPEVFSRPGVYDLTRPHEGDHLAFSAGVHYCPGAPLARLEATIAIRELATRLPRLASTGRATWRRTTTLRGAEHIPVRVVH